jgi:PncC family amidohydrolase
MEKRLQQAIEKLVQVLKAETENKVVFAESCTAGLVAATLARTPGISEFLCGSVVVYRESAKQAFLNINPETLAEYTDVSSQVSEQMAVNALGTLQEANWSASITGHLGPGVPSDLDGKVFIAIAKRDGKVKQIASRSIELSSKGRIERQREAACCVLELLCEIIQG